MIDPGDEALVHAYHDGELRALRRWRVRRLLARSAAARGLLRDLRAVGELLRENDAEVPPPVDLWADVAARLPDLGALRARSDLESAGGRRPWRPLRWLPTPVAPLAVAAGLAALAIGIALNLGSTRATDVVRSIAAGDRSVLLLADASDATIIWLLDDRPEAP
jgi:anti-sigma-K factor RskA